MNEIDKNSLKLYLLGQLGQEQTAQFEQRLLTEKGLYDELLISEEELLDQYLANELSSQERHSVESHFLQAPERRQQLRFARTFRLYVDNSIKNKKREQEPAAKRVAEVGKSKTRRPFSFFLPFQNPVISYTFVTVLVLAIVGISWSVFNRLRTPTEQPGSVLLVTLSPGLVRDEGQTTSIRIPAGTGAVQLRLVLRSDDYQSYLADVTRDGESILTNEHLKPESIDNSRVLRLTVPASLLSPQDYRVKVSGRRIDGDYEVLDSYSFRVAR